jgi:hypothetical protein
MPSTATYEQIIRAIALKIQAIAGSDSATVQSAYVASPITTTQIDSPDFPLGPLRDIVAEVEERLAIAIANYVVEDKGELFFHPWRVFISSVTTTVPNGSTLPISDAAGNPIVGVPGLVTSLSSGQVFSRLTMAELRDVSSNANGWARAVDPVCAFNGNRLYHNGTDAIVDVCTYNRSVQTTRILIVTNTILLPDALEEAYVNGGVSMAFRDDAWLPQAAAARNYFNSTLENIGAGLMALAKAA